jgi:hypothetical protein
MTIHLGKEAEHALRDFLSGHATPEEFEAWIISAIDDLSTTEQEALWSLRLLLVEAGEGLRTIYEARAEAQRLLDNQPSPRSRTANL